MNRILLTLVSFLMIVTGAVSQNDAVYIYIGMTVRSTLSLKII